MEEAEAEVIYLLVLATVKMVVQVEADQTLVELEVLETHHLLHHHKVIMGVMPEAGRHLQLAEAEEQHLLAAMEAQMLDLVAMDHKAHRLLLHLAQQVRGVRLQQDIFQAVAVAEQPRPHQVLQAGMEAAAMVEIQEPLGQLTVVEAVEAVQIMGQIMAEQAAPVSSLSNTLCQRQRLRQSLQLLEA